MIFFSFEYEGETIYLRESEFEVFKLLSTGISNSEIASKLFISIPAVRSRLKLLYSKLSIHNRTKVGMLGYKVFHENLWKDKSF